MLPGTTDDDLASQLLQITRDPELRQRIYERLGDYCHQCRNRLNSVKLSLYLAKRQSTESVSSVWSELDLCYQVLEHRVDQIQTLFRPMTLSSVTLGIDLLIDDRRDSWTNSMASNGRSLEFIAPAERAIASFDVERMGRAFDRLIDWRASDGGSAGSARVRWWVEAGYAHIAWDEFGPESPRQVAAPRNDASIWALPLMIRVAQAHKGEIRVQHDREWKLEVSWPSTLPDLVSSESSHEHFHTRDRGELGP